MLFPSILPRSLLGRQMVVLVLMAMALLATLGACGQPTTGAPTPTPPTLPTPTSQSGPAQPGAQAQDKASLLDALRQGGMSVEAAGSLQQPFLSVPGESVKVNNADIQVFEYPDEAAVEGDASKITPDGHIRGASIGWMAQPHFYRSGRLLVIYLWTDPAMLAALESALGKPFATGQVGPGLGAPTP
jgi:hypothetical protein